MNFTGRVLFIPHSAPNGLRKYKFLILSAVKKKEEYFQVFRVFFLSLRIESLRFIKRLLGAECGIYLSEEIHLAGRSICLQMSSKILQSREQVLRYRR